MLSTVVLPAPLGPITEKISPFWTSRLTFVTAWTPPNAFETPRISTSALICPEGATPPAEYSRQPPLAPAVMLHVAIALPLPDAGEPEVELLDILVLADRPGVAVEDDAPVLHHVPVLRDPERHRGVLPGEQGGHPRPAGQPAHDLEDLVHQHRREPHRGLVEQHEPGPRHERAADRHHLLRSEEHTSELQSLAYLVCRLLLE